MDRFTITTYAAAIARMEEHGYLSDVGQIAPSVHTQLHMAMQKGQMTNSRDTWPIRGLPQDGACPVVTVWEMVEQEVEA